MPSAELKSTSGAVCMRTHTHIKSHICVYMYIGICFSLCISIRMCIKSLCIHVTGTVTRVDPKPETLNLQSFANEDCVIGFWMSGLVRLGVSVLEIAKP